MILGILIGLFLAGAIYIILELLKIKENIAYIENQVEEIDKRNGDKK